ncbi:hypothetical protein GCM10022221_14520 [Actinocorallia aurea]
MMEGVLRHCTDATIDRQYTDTHGQSLVGFAFSHAAASTSASPPDLASWRTLGALGRRVRRA